MEKASWNLAPGDEIAPGRSVLKSLGGGKRFEVFAVWDDRLCTSVVAKVLRPDKVEDERAQRAFRREAELAERLAHPFLVRGFGAVLDGPYPHLLLEDLDGPSLRRLLRRHGPVPLEQVMSLGVQIAALLHYLAAEGVVHFDVKPSNIVMNVPPRLIDLSLARTLADAAEIQKPVGTHAYMAPEICEVGSSEHRPGPASDIWGLGATLYHAAVGEVPFPREPGAADADDPAVRFPQLVEEPSPLGKAVPPDFEDLVLDMLARDPAERPAAGEVVEDLESLVAELP
jgi:eukaryotic-like serine/threonine-protein kinase